MAASGSIELPWVQCYAVVVEAGGMGEVEGLS